MHNLLSNPNHAPITDYRRIKSEAFSKPNDLVLTRLLDMRGFESLVPGIDDWNLLVKRPLNVIERIEGNTGNHLYNTVFTTKISFTMGNKFDSLYHVFLY